MKKDHGYVALEFVVAMGLLVLPTALVLLQIPTYLERHNRLESIAAMVSQECATKADNTSEANAIALDTSRNEISYSSVMGQATLVDASCNFSDSNISPGSQVTASVSLSMPAAVVPGADMGPSWTMTSQHVSIVPKYRSFEE